MTGLVGSRAGVVVLALTSLSSWLAVADVRPTDDQGGGIHTFESSTVGQLPTAFETAAFRQPEAGAWAIARRGDNNFIHHAPDDSARGWAMAIHKGAPLRDVLVSARVRLGGGARVGGVVWRYRDARNFHAAVLDLDAQKISTYRVTDGSRVRFDVRDGLELDAGAWYTLKVLHEGTHVYVWLGGIRVLTDEDRRHEKDEPGRSGLLAGGSADAAFDDFGLNRAGIAHLTELEGDFREFSCELILCGWSRIQTDASKLLVEDEPDLARALARSLADEHCAVDVAFDGEDGLARARDLAYDVIVLDLMLPKIDGWTVLQTLRKEQHREPILLLTARDDIHDRVRGLDLGADDYLTKPFAVEELVARLRALMRRAADQPSPELLFGNLRIDTAARRVYLDGSEVELTAREYSILELLTRRRGAVVSRTAISEFLYNDDSELISNAIDVHIGSLRRKLGPGFIHTRRGLGYLFDPEPDDAPA